jgi:hypothetical protein
MANKTKRASSKVKIGTRKTISRTRRIQAAGKRLDDIVRDLGPNVVAEAAERSEEISKTARVSQSDMQLRVSM